MFDVFNVADVIFISELDTSVFVDAVSIILSPYIIGGYTMDRILEGLKEVHKHNYLHRDIKPANIMLALGGAKLSDMLIRLTQVNKGYLFDNIQFFSHAMICLKQPS